MTYLLRVFLTWVCALSVAFPFALVAEATLGAGTIPAVVAFGVGATFVAGVAVDYLFHLAGARS